MTRTVRTDQANQVRPEVEDHGNSNVELHGHAQDTLQSTGFTGDLAKVDWGALSFDTAAGRGGFTSELLRGLRSKDPQRRAACADSLSELAKSVLEDHTRVPTATNPSREQLIKEASAAVIEQASDPFPKIRTTH
jgi:hypothetical protein